MWFIPVVIKFFPPFLYLIGASYQQLSYMHSAKPMVAYDYSVYGKARLA